jgi:hypothetical protein
MQNNTDHCSEFHNQQQHQSQHYFEIFNQRFILLFFIEITFIPLLVRCLLLFALFSISAFHDDITLFVITKIILNY